MNTASARTWLVVLPVVGGGVAGGLGFVIPGLSPVLLGVAGLGAGAALAILLVYLATKEGEQSDAGGATAAGSQAGGRSGTSSTVSNARLEVVVTDDVTGERVPGPVEVTAEQTFVDERRRAVAEDGHCAFDLRTLTWTVTASYAGRSATVEAEVGDVERVEVTLPPKRVTVSVEDRAGDPLSDATVSCTVKPVDASRVADDAGPGERVLEVPTATERVTLVADHDDFETERADVLVGDDPTTETTVTLERPASEREVTDSTADVESADADPETVDTESPFAVARPETGGSASDARVSPAGPAESDSPTATPSEGGGGTSRQGGGTPQQSGGVSDRGGSGSGSASDRGSDRTGPGGPSDGDRDAPSDERTATTPDDDGSGAETVDGGESATETPDAGDGADAETPDGEAGAGTPEAARTPIPEVGVTGIDRHTPPYSSNPARLDLNADVLSDLGEDAVVSQTERATVKRVEVANRTVAVKGPGPDGKGADAVAETVARADEWRDIDDHPNVATLVDAGSDPYPYLAVEFGDRTLADADLPFDQTPGLWHAVRLADAVAQAHRNRVFHLAVKPSNVLLESVESSAWPVVKLTDWDLPRLLDLPNPIFKPFDDAYAAPEQVWSDRFDGVDERTDVYLLGVLTYELLTGDPPMDGAHATDRTADAPDERVPPVTGRRPELADELDRILRNATAVRKQDRYASAAELRDSLRSVATSVAGGF